MSPSGTWSRLSTLALVLASVACAGERAAGGVPADLRIAAGPSVQIGGAGAGPADELSDAASAVRLPDGTVVIAVSGAAELRFYGPGGELEHRVGRRGDGPGEFSGMLRLAATEGDSVLVFDSGDRRVGVYSAGGDFRGEQATEPGGTHEFPGSDWLVGATWVRQVPGQRARSCVAQALAHVPPAAPGSYRRAFYDGAHAVWLQEAAERKTWRLVDLSGASIAVATLPDGMELLAVAPAHIIGRSIDSMGFETVVVHEAQLPDGKELPRCDAGRAIPIVPATPGQLEVEEHAATELRNALVAQEMFFAGHGGYAGIADSLDWTSWQGFRLWLEAATPTSWAGVVTDPRTGAFCAIAVGSLTPSAWAEGAVKCGQRLAPREGSAAS